MAAGDTIAGQLEGYKRKKSGSRPKVLGPVNQDAVDTFTENAENKYYVNTGRSSTVTSPLQARDVAYPKAVFGPGEVFELEHFSADDSTGDSIDVSADEFAISVVFVDLNEPKGSPDRIIPGGQLTVADNEIAADPAESESGAVFFQYTVDDRTRMHIVGAFEAAAVEVA